MNYEVLLLDGQTQAEENAKDGKIGFYCEYDEKYYTYTDVSSGTPEIITEAHNDSMFEIEWNGTGIVLKGRKMFPR